MSIIKEFTKGIYHENPVFRLVLGLCPTLAVTSSVKNGIGMGISAAAVLVCSNFIIALVRNITPKKIRIPVFITVIATFVTIVEMVMNAYQPELYESLGIFVPLIVVNCIILGRAEAFASKNNILYSVVDGLGMGIGFTLSLVVISTIREILGNGTFYGMPVAPHSYQPILYMVLAPGAFLTLGYVLGFFNWLDLRKSGKGN
ncbi:MAG: electron transport complex subunit E [Candidatus Latescibacteria bacterium]|nr:electron transport complex subunit E [Candidatus Latescibacterota bacterium]